MQINHPVVVRNVLQLTTMTRINFAHVTCDTCCTEHQRTILPVIVKVCFSYVYVYLSCTLVQTHGDAYNATCPEICFLRLWGGIIQHQCLISSHSDLSDYNFVFLHLWSFSYSLSLYILYQLIPYLCCTKTCEIPTLLILEWNTVKTYQQLSE